MPLGKALVAFLGPFQQEEKSGKLPPLGAALADWGVFIGTMLRMRRGHVFQLLQVSCGKRTSLASEQEP